MPTEGRRARITSGGCVPTEGRRALVNSFALLSYTEGGDMTNSRFAPAEETTSNMGGVKVGGGK